MKSLWMVVLLLISCKSESYSQYDSTKNGYKSKLDHVIENLDDADNKMIESSIPTSRQEASIFYSLDYDKATSEAFGKLRIRINECALKDKAILIKYLYVSEFVDGYFAEDYFDDIEKIALKKRNYFCSQVQTLNKMKTKRLVDIIANYCK